MATETLTVSTRDAIRDWLRLVGDVYAIREVHWIKRPDNTLKPGGKGKKLHQWLTYKFLSSQTSQTQPVDNSTADGNTGNLDYYMAWTRQLRIECHGEDGMEVLEALMASVSHPAVSEILGAARLVIVDMPNGVDNETEDDETDVSHLYSCTFGVRVHTHFALTRANHVWDNYALTGTLTLLDDVTTVDVTTTDV